MPVQRANGYSLTKLVMYQSPFPSSSGLEGPMYQAELFSPFPISLTVPGPWAPFFTSLEGPRHPGCDDTITKQGGVTEHRALSIKSSSYETTVGFGPQLPLDSKAQGSGILPPSSASPKFWVINIFPHAFIPYYDYYIDTTSQVLRFDPFCRASRWLRTVSQPVIQILC